MRVRLGNMLGKGCGVGRIAASVVQWARAVPLDINHDLRWVGGLCALNGTSVGGAVGSVAFGVPGPGRQLNECCQSTAAATEANPGGFWGLFGCSQRLKNKPAQKNIFFVKKMDIWHIRAPDGPKSGPIFFSRRTKILPPAKGPKKGPECGRMGVGSKIGRLGASERRNPKLTTPQIW